MIELLRRHQSARVHSVVETSHVRLYFNPTHCATFRPFTEPFPRDCKFSVLKWLNKGPKTTGVEKLECRHKSRTEIHRPKTSQKYKSQCEKTTFEKNGVTTVIFE